MYIKLFFMIISKHNSAIYIRFVGLCCGARHTGARPNGIDLKVSRHHTASVSNFKSIKLSTDNIGRFIFYTATLIIFFRIQSVVLPY